jgi:hypothetical protein
MNFQVACDHNVDIFFICFNVFSSHVLHLDVGSTLHIPGQKTNTAPRIKRNWSCSRPWRWRIFFLLYMIFFSNLQWCPHLLNQDMKPLYSIDRCSFPFSLEIVFITEIHPLIRILLSHTNYQFPIQYESS